MKYIIYILIALILLSCNSRSRDSLVVLNKADSLMRYHPENALSLLNKSIFNSSRLVKARFALLYTKALYKNYIAIQNDSLINIAVDYYKKRDQKSYAESLLYKGSILIEMKNYHDAMRILIPAEDIALRYDNFELLGFIYSRIAEIHIKSYAHTDILIEKLNKAAEYFSKIEDNKNESIIYFQIASNHLVADSNKDSTLKYIEHSLNFAKKYNYMEIASKSYYLLLEYYQQYENYYAIKKLGLRILEEFPPDQTNRILHLISIAYAKTGQIDSAILYYNMIGNNNNKLRNYYTRSIIEECTHNYKNALCLYKQSQRIADSITNERMKHNTIEFEKRYQNQYLVLQNKTLKHEYQIHLIISISIVLILLLFMMILLVKMKHRKQIINDSRSFIEQLKLDLSQNSESFQNIISKNDLIISRLGLALEKRLETLNKLVDLSYRFEKFDSAFYSEYKKIMNVEKLNTSLFNDIRELANIKNYYIIDHIKNRYPQLTKEDLDFISLLCCNFSATAMCVFYGHKTPETIYVKRSRLSKKMHLQKPISVYLSDTISSLSENTSY